jgi:hypothetical protein
MRGGYQEVQVEQKFILMRGAFVHQSLLHVNDQQDGFHITSSCFSKIKI